jgi:O-antigen ligase
MGIVVSCLYFLCYATTKYTDFQGYGIRHCLKNFYISYAGLMCAIGFFCIFVRIIQKYRILETIEGLIILSTLLYCMSKNAFISIPVVSVIWLLCAGYLKINLKTIIITCLIIGIVYYILFKMYGNIVSFLIDSYSENKDDSEKSGMLMLTGRGSIWEAAMTICAKNPYFGYGYYSSSQLLENITTSASQAHNAFYQLLMTVGYVGCTLIIIYIGRVLHSIQYLLKIGYKSWQVGLLFCLFIYFVFFRSITEGSFAQVESPDVFYFYLCTTLLINLELLYKKKRFTSMENIS